MNIILFEKDYDGESLYDLTRDIAECLEDDYNPKVKDIPQNQYGFASGTFKVKIVWSNE